MKKPNPYRELCLRIENAVLYKNFSLINVYVVCPQSTMQISALSEISEVLVGELEEPLRFLEQIIEPFQQAYDVFKQTVKQIKEAWRVIRNGYE